jgi:DNA/RNA-binding domain of Phe-tRNA-synthetase-like protein
MTDAKVRRILHIRFALPGVDAAHLQAILNASTPFLKMIGGTGVRLLQNVDDPARYVQEIEYESAESIEVNRQRIASDPHLQQYLQAWRAIGASEVDVYRDVAAG